MPFADCRLALVVASMRWRTAMKLIHFDAADYTHAAFRKDARSIELK